jgi:hypothetical protein
MMTRMVLVALSSFIRSNCVCCGNDCNWFAKLCKLTANAWTDRLLSGTFTHRSIRFQLPHPFFQIVYPA